jgi:hypothetical protein
VKKNTKNEASLPVGEGLGVRLKGEATTEQIAVWKQKHSKIWQIEVDGHVCYLRKPTRQEISLATILGTKNPIAYKESIINSCWLGGSDAIKTDDDLFMSVSSELPALVEFKLVEIKNL